MLIPASFDPSAYTRVPMLDMAAMLTLCRQLLTEALPGASGSLKACQGELQGATTRAEADYRAQLQVSDEPQGRVIDPPADNAWSCLYRRLGAYADLPVERHPRAGRAQELRDQLFPDGLRFTQLEYGAQYSEAERRVQIMQADRGRILSEVAALSGQEFVDELLHTHAAYGELVGATRRKAVRTRPDLRETRLQLMNIATAYLIQLVAMYVSPGISDKTRTAIERSFAAVDLYRGKVALDRKRGEEPPAPPIVNPPSPEPDAPPSA